MGRRAALVRLGYWDCVYGLESLRGRRRKNKNHNNRYPVRACIYIYLSTYIHERLANRYAISGTLFSIHIGLEVMSGVSLHSLRWLLP